MISTAVYGDGLMLLLLSIVLSEKECRLRQGDSSSSEAAEGSRLNAETSAEAGTPVKIYEGAEQSEDSGKSNYRDQWEKERSKKQLEREKAAGSVADSLAPNQHYSMTNLFKDLGRRFIPQYPYYEREKQELEDEKAEDSFHKAIQDSNVNYGREDMKLLPLKASPDLVLSVVKKSKALEDSKAVNPADELIKKQILRSGDYWNGVWKEDVQPNILRSGHVKLPLQDKVVPLPKLGSVRTKIMPGTKLYQLISVLRRISPRFLYVMNEK